jgi:hypothetical protein
LPLRGARPDKHTQKLSPEEKAKVQKELDELKKAPSTDMAFKTPQIHTAGPGATQTRQGEKREELQWIHNAEKLDLHTMTEFKRIYQTKFVDVILNGEDTLRKDLHLFQNNPENCKSILLAYMMSIENNFGDLRTKSEKTPTQNKAIREEYKKSNYREKSLESNIDLALLNADAQTSRAKNPEKAKEITEDPIFKTNVEFVKKAIRHANISPGIAAALYKEFTTAILQSENAKKNIRIAKETAQLKQEILNIRPSTQQNMTSSATVDSTTKRSLDALAEIAKRRVKQTSAYKEIGKKERNKEITSTEASRQREALISEEINKRQRQYLDEIAAKQTANNQSVSAATPNTWEIHGSGRISPGGSRFFNPTASTMQHRQKDSSGKPIWGPAESYQVGGGSSGSRRK